jgi:hypothetical protein
VKRWVALPLIALSAVAVSAAGAKDPTPPAGTWDLKTIRATYSGPPAPLRLALTKLIQGRVVFSPACTQTVCATYATVRNARGTRVKFVMIEKSGVFTGRAVMATGLRCGGRALRATLTMTARLIQRQAEPVDVLTGMTEARAQNPGGCSLFRGQARGVRKHWFYGVAVNG